MFAKFNRSLYRPVYKRLIIDAYEEMFMIQDHLINISSVLDEVYATFFFVVSFNKYLDNIPAVVDSELGKIANIDPKLCQLLRGDIFTGIRLYNSGIEIPKMELELLVCRSPRYFSKIQDYLKMMTPENENLIPSVVDWWVGKKDNTFFFLYNYDLYIIIIEYVVFFKHYKELIISINNQGVTNDTIDSRNREKF